MARYKLLSQHFSEEDKLLEADTEVGDGTPHKWTRRPTAEMEALDDEGRQLLEKEKVRARENGLQWGRIAPLEDLPLTMGEVEEKYEQEVKAAESPQGTASTQAESQARDRDSTTGRFAPSTTLADRARR